MITGLFFTLLIAFLSCCAGIFGSLVGIGGGIIITPLLVIGFGINIHYAMGASLCAVIGNSIGASTSYLKEGFTNLKMGLFFSLATTTGAILGAFFSAKANQPLLMIIFGGILLLTLFFSLWKKNQETIPPEEASTLAKALDLGGSYYLKGQQIKYDLKNIIPGFFAMGVAGLLSGLLGIGSGVFKVVAMDHLMRVPFRVSTATSSLMIGITATASAGVYLKKGYIDPALAAPIILGVFVGSLLGAKVMSYLPLRLLKITFAITILVIGVEMIHRGLAY